MSNDFTKGTENWGESLYFFFPKLGGLGEFSCRIILNTFDQWWFSLPLKGGK